MTAQQRDDTRTVFIVRLRTRPNVDSAKLLRRLLKRLKRQDGLECISACEETRGDKR